MLIYQSLLIAYSMRRRFRQNQEDCTFVLLAQLPTLSRQLFAELDVEALTAELQRRADEAKKDKQTAKGLESSTGSLVASAHIEDAHKFANGDAQLDASFHSTFEAAQVPLPSEQEPAEPQPSTGEVRYGASSNTRQLMTMSCCRLTNLWIPVRRQNCGKLSRYKVSSHSGSRISQVAE